MDLVAAPGRRLFHTSPRDGWVLAGTILHAGGGAIILYATAHAPLPLRALGVLALALGLCWSANTVAHVHLHTPIFRRPGANRLLTLAQSVALAIPLSGWRARHLRHHGLPPPARAKTTARVACEATLIGAIWAAVAVVAPGAVATFVVAWALGLGLCALQGHYEHADAAEADGVDHHGRLYNRLWFNDGHHAQHHRAPDTHWTAVPDVAGARARVSDWPPLLGWLAGALDRLEQLPLRSAVARRLVLAAHQRAFDRLLPAAERTEIRRVCIVGGALFPRTALILRRLMPHAHLVIVDSAAAHVAVARRLLAGAQDSAAGRVSFLIAAYDPVRPPAGAEADLLIVPLAFRGDRGRFYAAPPAPRVIVHDWIWRRRGATGRVVALWLLKRINLVRRAHAPSLSAAGFDTLGQELPWPPAPLPCLRPPSSSIVTSSCGSPAPIGRPS